MNWATSEITVSTVITRSRRSAISDLTVLLRTGKDGAEPQKAPSHNSPRGRAPKNDATLGAFLLTTRDTPARKAGIAWALLAFLGGVLSDPAEILLWPDPDQWPAWSWCIFKAEWGAVAHGHRSLWRPRMSWHPLGRAPVGALQPPWRRCRCPRCCRRRSGTAPTAGEHDKSGWLLTLLPSPHVTPHIDAPKEIWAVELFRSAASAGWELGVRWVVREMAKPSGWRYERSGTWSAGDPPGIGAHWWFSLVTRWRPRFRRLGSLRLPTRPSTSMSHVVAGTPGGAARPPASRWPMQFVCSHSLLSRSTSRDSSQSRILSRKRVSDQPRRHRCEMLHVSLWWALLRPPPLPQGHADGLLSHDVGPRSVVSQAYWSIMYILCIQPTVPMEQESRHRCYLVTTRSDATASCRRYARWLWTVCDLTLEGVSGCPKLRAQTTRTRTTPWLKIQGFTATLPAISMPTFFIAIGNLWYSMIWGCR